MKNVDTIKVEEVIKKTITVKQFSRMYGIGENKAYEIVNMPNFPMIKCGKKIVIIYSRVDDWLVSNIGRVF